MKPEEFLKEILLKKGIDLNDFTEYYLTPKNCAELMGAYGKKCFDAARKEHQERSVHDPRPYYVYDFRKFEDYLNSKE